MKTNILIKYTFLKFHNIYSHFFTTEAVNYCTVKFVSHNVKNSAERGKVCENFKNP